MPKNTKVQDLKINVLTEAQYDAAVREEVIGDYELSLLTDMVDKAVQVEVLPTASAEELGNIYQYVGATNANYTNGYFYKCVSDGASTPAYSWEAISVQSVTKEQVGLGNVDNTSDADKPISTATQAALDEKASIVSLEGKLDKTTAASKLYGTNASGQQVRYDLSYFAAASDLDPLVIQWSVLPEPTASLEGVIYEYVGETNSTYTNGYFYKCVGTSEEIETVSTMPAASAQEAGKIYQYVGETNSNYTNNTYYKCTSDGLFIDDWSSTEYETFSWKEVITDTSGIETVSELPEASEQELGNIYKQGDKYYKCTSFLMAADWGEPDVTAYKWSVVETLDVSDSTYAWEQVNVQPQPTIGSGVLTIQKNGTAVNTFSANASEDKVINITVPVNAADVNALPDSTKYAANASLTMDSSTFVVTLQLKDQDGANLGTAQTIDLPLESVVVSGSYDNTNKKIILTLKDGSTIDVPVADLVAGLQSEITSENKLDADLVDDTNSVHKFVTAAEKAAWNDKAEVVFREWNEGE